MNLDLQHAIDQYGEYCLRIAYLTTKDWGVAEEVVQDVFLAYAKNQYQEKSSLKTYLVQITLHKSKNALRFKWAKKRTPVYIEIENSQSSEQLVLQKEHEQSVTQALFQLPHKYREVLILHYYADYSIKEIAHILKTNENTVKTRLKRAREKLKPLLQEEVLPYGQLEAKN